MSMFNGVLSIPSILSKTRALLCHFERVNSSILEEIANEDKYVQFLEKAAFELKESRRRLRTQALKNRIQQETREKDTSARSSVRNLQNLKVNNKFGTFEVEPESNSENLNQLGASKNPSYFDLNPQENLGLSTHSGKAQLMTSGWANLYHSSEQKPGKAGSTSGQSGKRKDHGQETKDLQVSEVERPPNKAGVRRGMNSPKASSRLLTILEQIGKAKLGVGPLSPSGLQPAFVSAAVSLDSTSPHSGLRRMQLRLAHTSGTASNFLRSELPLTKVRSAEHFKPSPAAVIRKPLF